MCCWECLRPTQTAEVVHPRDSDADLWMVRGAAAARAEGAVPRFTWTQGWRMVGGREVVAGVEVVYPRDSDADLWIVREAAAARAEGAPRVVVVTGDTEVAAGLALTDATGAMPSDMYLLEMRRVC